MTLQGLGSPPPFQVTFSSDEQPKSKASDADARKDGQWNTVKTDSEVLIDKLGELSVANFAGYQAERLQNDVCRNCANERLLDLHLFLQALRLRRSHQRAQTKIGMAMDWTSCRMLHQ